MDNSPKDNKRSDDDNGVNDWYNLYQKRQHDVAKAHEDLKKQIDADPFGMLFGWRNSKGCHPQHVSSTRSDKTDMGQCKAASTTEGRQKVKDSVPNSKETLVNNAAGDESGPSSHESTLKPFVGQEIQSEEFEIDPITMRKVPKRHRDLASSSQWNGLASKYSIPVKKYRAPTAEKATEFPPSLAGNQITDKDSALGMKEVAPKAAPGRHSWLLREGFSAGDRQAEVSQPSLRSKEQAKSRDGKFFKIESALDRHLMAQGKIAEQDKADQSGLRYTDRENTIEDIDLLRPSDVRASSGLKGKPLRALAKEKQGKRKYLEDDFNTRAPKLDAQYKEEIASQKASYRNMSFDVKPTKAAFDFHSNQTTLDLSHMNKINGPKPGMTNGRTSSHKPSIQALQKSCPPEMESHQQKAADDIHQKEVKTQKDAMEAIEARNDADTSSHRMPSCFSLEPGEGDMASNIHEFISRDRWYKQKAPHAAQSDRMLQQKNKDFALVHEIRSIYEDEYGIIDTSHRQPSDLAFQGDKHQIQTPKTAGPPHLELGSIKEQSRPNHIINPDEQSLNQPSSETRSIISDSHGRSSDSINFHTEGHQGIKESEALTMTEKALKITQQPSGDTPQNQQPFQGPSTQNSLKNPAEAVSAETLNSSNAYEQNLMQILKGAWDLFRTGTGLSSFIDSQNDPKIVPFASSESTKSNLGSHPSLKAPTKDSSSSLPSTSYKILAYDSSMQKVLTAKTCFSTNPFYDKPLTVVEALSGLTNPARFLPHFVSLQNAGYEIVSGGSNILIFRKLEQEKPAAEPLDELSQTIVENHPMHTNPIDGTTTQTGNFASPTGFVNHDSILPPSDREDWKPAPAYTSRSNANDKIRREEPVFSGSRKGWQEDGTESKNSSSKFRNRQRRIARRKRTMKRMFWVGTFVAGCCYAVGVASEALRA